MLGLKFFFRKFIFFNLKVFEKKFKKIMKNIYILVISLFICRCIE